jgi:O-antigen/teichoic acid export membrane protein
MRLSTTSKKTAVILSYVSLVFKTLSTMFLTRFYLNELGTDTYGLYQMVYSVAHYILILDLGISVTMVRYITEFDAQNKHEKAENFAFHFIFVVAGIALVVSAIGIVVNANLERIYTTLTPDEYAISHRMFSIMILQIVLTIISHYFRGIALAHEQFVFSRLISIAQILLNIGLIIAFVLSGMGILGITTANTIVIALVVGVYAVYDFFVLKFKVKFHYWDFMILRPAFLLMLAMLLQSVVGHVNSSVDKTILGIMATKKDVAIYSIAATIVTMFNSLPTTISSVFQPKAVKMVVKEANNEELTDLVIAPGRFQFMIVGAFLAGFFLFGRDFIICWAGKEMTYAWSYVLIIMIPNSIPLIQNVCLSILNAKDKRIFRSIILAALTIVNIGLTILFINLFGPIGAPLGTGISYVLGHCITMNIYYKKKIGLNVRRMFTSIFSHTWICVLISLVINLPLMLWRVDGNWFVLILKGLIFCAVYFASLVFFGFNNSEKKTVSSVLRKLSFGNRNVPY